MPTTIYDPGGGGDPALRVVNFNNTPIGSSEYTEGETDATLNVTVVGWEDASDTVRAVSAVKPLPVDPGSPVLAAAADALGVDTHLDASVSNTAEVLKASAGTLYGWRLVNNHASTGVWIQVFNVAAASVTLGTTTPKDVFYLPGGAVDSVAPSALGIPYGTAMSYACTATATGSGAPAAAATVVWYLK